MNNKLIAVALSFVANAIMPSTDSSLKVKTGNLAETGRDTSPAPYSAKSKKNFSKMIGRPRGKAPIAPLVLLLQNLLIYLNLMLKSNHYLTAYCTETI